MRRALFLGIALLLCVTASTYAQWTLYKISGRDYVPLENVAQFYGLGHLQHSGNELVMELGGRSLKGSMGSVEFYINRLKFNLSYPIAESGNVPVISRMDLTKVIEPVLRPQKIKNAELIDTVVLDAGHGGHDNGATSVYGFEKNFTLDVANRARLLFMQAGYKVVMTRTNDTFISLYDRTRYANQFPNALFISIHFNSGGNGTGLETYTLAPRGVPSMMADGPRISDYEQCAGNVNDSENIALATATHAALVMRSRMYDRGIKRARFVVIRDITIPGVLIEGGFLSNDFDARLIALPAYRQQMASSILMAVQNYRRAVVPQSTDNVARNTTTMETPRVETNSPMLRGGAAPVLNENGPTVITSANAAGSN
jgi:N-acetylmuramoyl-L-alanine amidase